MDDEKKISEILYGDKIVEILKDNDVVGYVFNRGTHRFFVFHEVQPGKSLKAPIQPGIGGITDWMKTHGYTFGEETNAVIFESSAAHELKK